MTVRIKPAGALRALKPEGRFWTAGVSHKVRTLELVVIAPETGQPPIYAARVLTECGDTIDEATLLNGREPVAASPCKRGGCRP